MKTTTKLWIGLGILVILTPLGLLAKGTPWGEWASEELKAMLGFVPEGLKGLENIWSALMKGYNLPGWDSPLKSALGYILSAILGVGLVVAVSFLFGKLLSSKNGKGQNEA